MEEMDGKLMTGCSLQVQTIVYGLEADAILRTIVSLMRSFELAKAGGVLHRIKVRIGDTSGVRCLNDEQVSDLKNKFQYYGQIDYNFFNENVGSARGHNLLADGASEDYLMILNPDVVIAPRTLERMLEPFSSDLVGMTEARQLPIEHPKDYNSTTGETGWATTACAITPRDLFESIGGFDADSFFLYCDDVDYSWMVREAGKKVIYLPQATAFHDKRLSSEGGWLPSSAEVYYSAEAALMIMHKWSFHESLEKICDVFQNGSKDEKAALANFMVRKEAGTLPLPRDPKHKVGYLDRHHHYTKHRYML